MELTDSVKMAFLDKAIKVAEAAAQSGGLSPQGLAQTIEMVYDKIIEIAKKA